MISLIKRPIIIVGAILVLVSLLSLAFCGRGKKAITPNPANVSTVQLADPPAITSTTSALNRAEEAIKEIQEGLLGLTSRVEALEKKPAPQVITRVTDKTNRKMVAPAPQVPAVPATTILQPPAPQPLTSDSPLSDEERARRYWEQYQRFHNQP